MVDDAGRSFQELGGSGGRRGRGVAAPAGCGGVVGGGEGIEWENIGFGGGDGLSAEYGVLAGASGLSFNGELSSGIKDAILKGDGGSTAREADPRVAV